MFEVICLINPQKYIAHIKYKIDNHWITKDLDAWGYYGEYKKSTYFMFYILPKIIFSIALFIDIVCLNKIHYLYLILTILWIPLLFHIMLYILVNWAEIIRNYVTLRVEIDFKFDDYDNVLETKITPIIPERLWGFTVTECFALIKPYITILLHREYLKACSETPWVKYLNLIIFTLFVIIWCYVLYLKIM